MAGLLVLICLASLPAQRVQVRKMGVPEGAAGLLAAYVLQEKMAASGVEVVRYERQILYDCCAAVSQYALVAGHFDLAIMCPDGARALVAKDDRFEIVGPVLMNGDIFVLRPGGRTPSSVGISQKRAYQRHMAAKRFGAGCATIPMLHAAVPFAFAKQEVDAAVVDITKAFNLTANFSPTGGAGEDQVTAVLVVQKKIKSDKRYLFFLQQYNDAVEEMHEPAKLLHLLQTYSSEQISIRDVHTWQHMNVRFVSPSANLPPG